MLPRQLARLCTQPQQHTPHEFSLPAQLVRGQKSMLPFYNPLKQIFQILSLFLPRFTCAEAEGTVANKLGIAVFGRVPPSLAFGAVLTLILIDFRTLLLAGRGKPISKSLPRCQQSRGFKKLASPGPVAIDSLIVTQIGIRTPSDEMKRMAMYIASGGRFIQPPLVSVARFVEDPEKLYVYDGHHRMIAIWLAGRKILLGDEFEFVEGSYAKCRKIDWDEKFVYV